MKPIVKSLIKTAIAVGALKGAYKLGKIAGAAAAYRKNIEYAEVVNIAISPRLSVEVGPGFVSATVVSDEPVEDEA